MQEPSITVGPQRGLLALFVKDPDLLFRTEVTPEHFDVDHLRAIYEVLIDLRQKGVEITPESIYNATEPKIQKFLATQTAGDGIDWVKAALWQPSSVANFERYEKAILEDAKRREFKNHIETVAARVLAAPPTTDLNKLASEVVSEVEQAYSLTLHGASKGIEFSAMNAEEFHREMAEVLKAAEERGPLSFGSRDFDHFVQGLPYGRFAILVADKKAGKSTFLMGLAMTIAIGRMLNDDNEWQVFNEHPEPVLILDNEMDYKMDFRPRALAWLSGVEVNMIRQGHYLKHPHLKKRIDRAVEVLNKGKVFFEKVTPGDVNEVKALVRLYKGKHGVRRVFYDYIKRPANVENMYIEMGNFAARMQQEVAKDLDVSLIAAAQAREDGRVAGSIDLMRECDISLKLSKTESGARRLAVDHSRFTQQMGSDEEYFDVLCSLEVARMAVGNLRGGKA